MQTFSDDKPEVNLIKNQYILNGPFNAIPRTVSSKIIT